MALVKVPENIQKIERSNLLTSFLNTTPDAIDPTWSVIGVGITDHGTDYNPQVEQEKWIIEDNSRTDHSSNQKQSDVTQKCYKGDPVFEYIAKCRDKMNCKTQILDVDSYDKTTAGAYPAKKSDATIVVTSWAGENAECEYSIYYDGDPVEGTVSIADGKPTFTEQA